MIVLLLFFFIKSLGGLEIANEFVGCTTYSSDGVTFNNSIHNRCSAYCYHKDMSVYYLKKEHCSCSAWKDEHKEIKKHPHDSCMQACHDDTFNFCGSELQSAAYSVCGAHCWGQGCQRQCMCSSNHCDIVTGVCSKEGCVAGFSGERCDWWIANGVDAVHAVLVQNYLAAMKRLGLISRSGELLNPIPTPCDNGHYSRGCSLSCHCADNSKCHNATGVCPSGCQGNYVGKRCDRHKACSPSKCKNKATCVVRDVMHYECRCRKAWVGLKCQYRDPCKRAPCKNGGVCVNHALFYTCACVALYVGHLCQTLPKSTWEVSVSNNFIGCFRNHLNVAFNLQLRRYRDGVHMDKQTCVHFCRGRLYTFAGVVDGHECLCANTDIFKRLGSVRKLECNAACQGSKSSSNGECGGDGLTSVYSVCGVQRWGPECERECYCAEGHCDFETGHCRYKGLCLYGYQGPGCNQRVFSLAWVHFLPKSMVALCGVSVAWVLVALCYFVLVFEPSEYKKLLGLGRLDYNIDQKIKFLKFFYRKARQKQKALLSYHLGQSAQESFL